MPQATPLKNKWVVITRPAQQSKNLEVKLKSAGANVILFPLLQISPPDDLELVKSQLEQLQGYDLVIFVSANAVEQSFHCLDSSDFNGAKVATIGKITADSLLSRGVKVDYCPDKIFNSEALLEIPNFHSFSNNKKIAIIRGEGGRDFLRDELIKNGAEVDYINAYKRTCPQNDLLTLKSYYEQDRLDTVLLTSGTSVTNFFNLVNKLEKENDWVNNLTLLLGSPRMQKKIPSSFQGKLLIADDPSDETLFEKLIEAL